MNKRIGRCLLVGAPALALVAAVAVAQAGIGKSVQKHFKGQVLITLQALPTDITSPKATIKAFEKLRQRVLHHETDDGTPTWSFQMTAFMKRAPRTSRLSLDFYTDDHAHKYVANAGLMGVDPRVPILSTHVSISTDDGLDVNKRYDVRLTATLHGREVVLARTKVTTK